MDTMRYQEHKKSSNIGLISFCAFMIVGGSLVFLGISQEEKMIASATKNNTEQVQSLVDVNEENDVDVSTIAVLVENETISDKSNSKIKSDITLPVITIQGEKLATLNSQINSKYTELFTTLKDQLKDVSNAFTFKVSYDYYDNTVAGKRILSVNIHQKIIDDETGKATTEKMETYNIDLKTNKVLNMSDIFVSVLGIDYKTQIKSVVKDYVVSKNMMKDEEYTYAITGLENFYIRDSKLHIVFNEGELVNTKYGVLDIVVPSDSKK